MIITLLKDFAPHPSLNDFVRCYRIAHINFEQALEPNLKAYSPRPEVCLLFFLRDRELIQVDNGPILDFKSPIVLAGQQTSAINRQLVGTDFIVFNIIFQPTALFRLTGISAFELTDQYLDAETIFNKNIRSVLDQLQNATSYNQMVKIADRFVNSLVANAWEDANRLDTISQWMIQSGGKASLDWLASESCLSTKQFTRKFYERTGVNPKTYQRIIRFSRAFKMKNASPKKDWLRIALECGYFDYQHLVKDYKEFTKHSPNDFHLLDSSMCKLELSAEIHRSRAESAHSLA